MLLFCPSCSNTLTITRTPCSEKNPYGLNRLECRTCPYQYILNTVYYERNFMKRKEVEDVFGGKGAWDNADNTDAQCPNEECDGDRAYFYQVQIRSADEPMTSFLKCTKCGHQWRED